MNFNSHTGKKFTGGGTVHPRDETNLANVNNVNNINNVNRNFAETNFRSCKKDPYRLVQEIANLLNDLDNSKNNSLYSIDPSKQSLCYELKYIFNTLSKEKINTITSFAKIIKDLLLLINKSFKELSINEKIQLKKTISEYNKKLNLFKSYIKQLNDSNIPDFTRSKLEMLHTLRMMCKDDSLKFKEYKPKLNIVETTTVNNIVVNTSKPNRLNYDGLPIVLEKHKIVFTIPETIKKKEGTKSNGVKFGFYDLDEFMSFLKCAIDEATPDQLLHKEYFDFSNNVFGSVIFEGYIFSIDLNVTHGFKEGKLNTTSKKIMHWLTNNDLKKSHITSNFLLAFNYSELFNYNNMVIKKIYQLINQKHNDPEFPLSTIQCYRQNCQHYNIYKKGVNQQGNLLKCTKCNISEFCILCEKTYHGNTPCNITVDEQTEIWISENTKACPNPNCKKRIQKNGGCNHMTCDQCSAHFCWLCNQIYTPNDVSNHYRGMNPYGGCINQVLVNNQGNHIQNQGNHIQDQGNHIQNRGNHIQDQGNDIHQNDEDDDDIPELEEFFNDLPILEHIDMPLIHFDRINLANNQDLDRMIALQMELDFDRIEENDMEDIMAEFRRNR